MILPRYYLVGASRNSELCIRLSISSWNNPSQSVSGARQNPPLRNEPSSSHSILYYKLPKRSYFREGEKERCRTGGWLRGPIIAFVQFQSMSDRHHLHVCVVVVIPNSSLKILTTYRYIPINIR